MRHFHGIQIDYSIFASIICPVMMRYHVACENKSRVLLRKTSDTAEKYGDCINEYQYLQNLIQFIFKANRVYYTYPSAQETSYILYLDIFKSFAEAATTAAA